MATVESARSWIRRWLCIQASPMRNRPSPRPRLGVAPPRATPNRHRKPFLQTFSGTLHTSSALVNHFFTGPRAAEHMPPSAGAKLAQRRQVGRNSDSRGTPKVHYSVEFEARFVGV